MKRRDLLLRGLAAPAVIASPAAWAQAPAWPSKPVKIVHGFGTGGPVDLLARMVAQQFGEKFGQQAIVEGKPGAGGTIGTNFVAKAEPDGHTFLLMASGHSAAPGLYSSLPYDAVGDFTMCGMVSRSPFAIVANPAAPFKTVQEFVAYAKAQPGVVNYGTGGQGTGMHLASVLMASRLGLAMTHVAYKSGGDLNTAVIGGQVPVMFTSLAGMKPLLDAGRLRALAVTSRNRYPGLPDIPTVHETVLPDFDVSAWYAVAGPKGLPPAIAQRMNEMLRGALAKPEVLELLRNQSAEPGLPYSPQEAQAFLARDVAHWTQVVRAEKITAPA